MGRKKFIKDNLKVLTIFFIIISLLSSVVSMKVYAENLSYIIAGSNETYEYEDLFTRYESFSTEYLRNSITYQIEAYKGTTASENYASINNQYLLIVSDLEELKSTKEQLITYRKTLLTVEDSNVSETQVTNTNTSNTLSTEENSENFKLIQEIDQQIAAIDVQIGQYNVSKISVGTSSADAKLQEDMASFYKIYQEQLTQDAKNRSKLNFKKRLINLIINKEQIQYYIYNKEYLTTLQQVEEIKYKNGLSNKVDVENAKLHYAKNDSTLISAQNNYTSAVNKIQYDTNIKENSTINLKLNFKKKEYDINNTVNLFIAHNSSYSKLHNLEDSYQRFLNSMGVTSYASYQQVKLQIDDYRLQRKELRYSIEAYVKEAIQQYNTAFLEMETAKTELSIKDKNYDDIKAKYDNKKATLPDIQKSYIDKESAAIAYYESCYRIVVWENILDKCIYGETP